MTHKIKRYGWTPDYPDHRDFMYSAPHEILQKLPPKVDLRLQCPAVYDQGELGSCTANAIAAAMEFEAKKQGLSDVVPSRLFIYYNERAMEGTVDSDSGAQIRDGIKSVGQLGVCPESEWVYDISKFTIKPSPPCFQDALKDRALIYMRLVQSINQLKGCLASGFPFTFGFSVYESFESQQVAQTGIVQMPQSTEKLLGGHAVLAVGYDDSQQRFTVRNSWGPRWGSEGYFTMPYAYLTDNSLSDDFWTIRFISKG